MSSEPMIKLDPQGQAPVLSYSVPESTSYAGRAYVRLDFPQSYFRATTRETPPRSSLHGAVHESIAERFRDHLSGRFDEEIAEHAGILSSSRVVTDLSGLADSGADPGDGDGEILAVGDGVELSEERIADIAVRLSRGERFMTTPTLFGDEEVVSMQEPDQASPHFVLVETYNLSSYRGNYGAGKVLKTFSLLPGEETTISIKTYTRRKSNEQSASSIFDSFTKESAKQFEGSVRAEQADKKTSAKALGYHVSASAGANFGFARAEVKAGVKGSSNSAREELAKNVTNATNKHAAKASAKRNVQVNTSYQVSEESGEETSIERRIENINVSRTLSFVFRQMNQEFISLLHLVDVRVAYSNGFSNSYREVPVSQLEALLEEVVVPSRRQEVRQQFIDELSYVSDYRDTLHPFVEEHAVTDDNGRELYRYLRTKKGQAQTYEDSATGTRISVPGVILGVTTNVLRTEGIIVDSLLGQGNGLDGYSRGVQTEAVRSQQLKNELLALQIEREKLAQKIVEDEDQDAAERYHRVFYPPPAPADGE